MSPPPIHAHFPPAITRLPSQLRIDLIPAQKLRQKAGITARRLMSISWETEFSRLTRRWTRVCEDV